MSAPTDRGDRPVTSPEAHWIPRDEQADRVPHEAMISPTQAVSHALSVLGRDASTADVCRFLQGCGVHVAADLVEKVREELTQG